MIIAIARYEFRQLLRSRQFWFVGVVFAVMSFLIIINPVLIGGGNINVNAPNNVVLYVTLLSYFAMFLVASMVAPSVARDFELNSWQLVFAYPVPWRSYLLGRFAGSFAAACLCYAFVIVGLLAGVHGPFGSAAVGPFRPGDYLYAFFVFAVPNIFMMSAILFAVSTLTRKSLYAYAGAVLMFILGNVAALAMNNEAAEPFIFLADPFGMAVLDLMTRFWTPYELNTTLVPLSRDLLWNRLVWTGLGLLLLGLTLSRFNPYPRSEKLKPGKDAAVVASAGAARPVTPQLLGGATIWQQFLLRTRFEIRSILRSVPFVVVLILGVFNTIAITTLVDPMFGSPSLPLTRVLVNAIGGGFILAMIIVVTYYAGELVWRERQVRVDQIIDALPAHNGAFMISKLIALWLVLLIMLSISAVAMMAYQLLAGTPIDVSMYLRELGYIALPFIWVAVLAMLCQTLAPNKYLGMFFMVIYMALTLAGSELFDTTTLIIYGTHPQHAFSGLAHSHLYLVEGLKYDLYWAALSVALVMATYLLWRRGTDEGVRSRLRIARRRIHPLQAAILTVSLLAFIGIGRWLYVEDYVDNSVPAGSDRTEAMQVQYEQVLRHLENQPIPMIRSIHLELDTFIENRRLLSRGNVVLENRSDQNFGELYLGLPLEAVEMEVTVNDGELIETWDEIHQFRFELNPPMRPGETRTVEFNLVIDHSEFPGGTTDARLETSGTAINLASVAPSFGYWEFNALSDPDTREKYGLPRERAIRATLEEDWGKNYSAILPFGDQMHFEGIYSVDKGQTAFLSGELINTWEENGRSYFHYKTDTPIVALMTVQQGEYEVVRDSVDGIDLAVYYNAEDDYHADEFLQHFKVATKYFSDNFGRYPYGEFRIIQKAGGQGANSNSGQLTFGEFAGFVSDLTEDTSVDWGTHVIGHEAGHNWWGIMAMSARTEGSHTLQETLAQYAGLMTLEHNYDRSMVGRFLRYSLKQYHTDRNASKTAEVPLIRSVQETDYVHYWKGAPVMYGIKELIGEEALNRALYNYFEEWGFAQGPYATTLDLMRHLRAETPAQYQVTLTDYFERILMHDLSVEDVRSEPTADGRFKVTATIITRKMERTADGKEDPVDIHEPLQIIVVDESIDSGDRYNATLLADERHWFDKERTEVEFIVDRAPSAVIVDPFHNFIERNMDDNVGRL